MRNALDKETGVSLGGIHYGVRPLVTPQLIREIYSRAEDLSGIVPVTPCVETIKVLKCEDGELTAVPGAAADRSVLYGAQTPQVFHSELIKAAYSMAYDTSFTDDASVADKYGKSLSYLIGERLNIKITTREDLILAQAILSARKG